MPQLNVLYISYDGMTEPLGRSQVIPYLIGLTKQGYNFTILSCEKYDHYQKYKETIEKLCKSSGINWKPLIYTKHPPVLSTIIDIKKIYDQAKKIYAENPYQIVHARGHYITSLIALSLKRKYQLKYIFDMRGFWADERVDGNIWKLSNPIFRSIYHFFKRKEKEFLENADQVITLTHAAEKEIHSWDFERENPTPITVIPCCADTEAFSLKNVDIDLRSRLKNDLGIGPDDYILLYLGSLGTWYMLEEMLDFFSVLSTRTANAKFLFVTNDAKENITQAVQARNIKAQSVIIVNASFEKVPTYISLAKASIFFIKPAYSKKGSSPIKQGELMSMGVPVICNINVGDTGEIVEKYQSGVVVKDFTTDSYEKAANEILQSHFDQNEIIKGANDYFSLEEGIKKYKDVYKKLYTQ